MISPQFSWSQRAEFRIATLSAHWRTLTVALLLAVVGFVALAFRAQSRSGETFAELIELHVQMRRWSQFPQYRAEQLPRLTALFRRHPALLSRFGGEFLQSAQLLNAAQGGDPWINRALEGQISGQKTPHFAISPAFESATLAAARGQWNASSLRGELPAPTGAEFGQLTALHLVRGLAAAELGGDRSQVAIQKGLIARALQEEGAGPSQREHLPMAALLSGVRSGDLALKDWALSEESDLSER